MKAAALKYEPEKDFAPVVVAAGCGHTADRIIALAEKSGVPVYRDDSAASVLCMLDAGRDIPPELYEVIAKVYCALLYTAEKNKNRTG